MRVGKGRRGKTRQVRGGRRGIERDEVVMEQKKRVQMIVEKGGVGWIRDNMTRTASWVVGAHTHYTHIRLLPATGESFCHNFSHCIIKWIYWGVWEEHRYPRPRVFQQRMLDWSTWVLGLHYHHHVIFQKEICRKKPTQRAGPGRVGFFFCFNLCACAYLHSFRFSSSSVLPTWTPLSSVHSSLFLSPSLCHPPHISLLLHLHINFPFLKESRLGLLLRFHWWLGSARQDYT